MGNENLGRNGTRVKQVGPVVPTTRVMTRDTHTGRLRERVGSGPAVRVPGRVGPLSRHPRISGGRAGRPVPVVNYSFVDPPTCPADEVPS